MDTQVLTYEEQYYKDRLGCLEDYRLGLSRHFGRPQPLADWVYQVVDRTGPASGCAGWSASVSAAGAGNSNRSCSELKVGERDGTYIFL